MAWSAERIGSASAGRFMARAGQTVRVSILAIALTVGVLPVAVPAQGPGPAFVELSWLSISNIYQRIGSLGVLIDGYITRIPESEFFGGGGGLANTRRPWKPDVPEISRVLTALGGPTSINLLLTGHSHFDHSFDTSTWSTLTGAPVVGSRTTCLQVRADGVPPASCTTVEGGERLTLAPGVTVWVVRWNHSGDPAVNPEQRYETRQPAACGPESPRIFRTVAATARTFSSSTERPAASAGSSRIRPVPWIWRCRLSSTAGITGHRLPTCRRP
jgi:hypothetical protein